MVRRMMPTWGFFAVMNGTLMTLIYADFR